MRSCCTREFGFILIIFVVFYVLRFEEIINAVGGAAVVCRK